MTKTDTILVQTDFTVNSLNVVIKALESRTGVGKVNLVLGYGIYSSDSITELLFHKEENLLNKLKGQNFEEALHVIRNKYGKRIKSIQFKAFKGVTQNAFANFIDSMDIEEAVIDQNIAYRMPNRNSFDLTPFIVKSDLKVTEITSDHIINMYDQVHFVWN